MLLHRNTILVLLCSSFFLMALYITFIKPISRPDDLAQAYLNFLDTTDKAKLDNIRVQFILKDLSNKTGFNYCGIEGYSGKSHSDI